MKSGCSSLPRPTSVIASRAIARFLAVFSSSRDSRCFISSTRRRRPAQSASSTSAERITAAIISWRLVIPSKVSRMVHHPLLGNWSAVSHQAVCRSGLRLLGPECSSYADALFVHEFVSQSSGFSIVIQRDDNRTQIRMARAALGWGVRDLAKRAGLSANTVADLRMARARWQTHFS